MLSVPEGVSPHLVLKRRIEEEPENKTHQGHLDVVKQYLYQCNDDQKPILTKIRSEVAQLNGSHAPCVVSKSDTPDDEDQTPAHPVVKSALDKRASMCQRMALVRQKKRRKRRRLHPVKPIRSPSPAPVTGDHWTQFKEPQSELLPGQYPGHVTEVERVTDYLKLKPEDMAEEPDPIHHQQMTLEPDTIQEDFMLNLELITHEDVAKIEEHRSDVKVRLRGLRNRTYIPEFTEKKQRETYQWLNAVNDITSPPLLRKRRRNALPIDLPVKRRRRNAANSRQSSPPESTASTSRPDTPPSIGKDEEESSNLSVAETKSPEPLQPPPTPPVEDEIEDPIPEEKTPVLEEPATPTLEEPSSPTPEEPPSPTLEEPPTPTLEEPPSPTLEEPPTPTLEGEPEPKKKEPAPKEEEPVTVNPPEPGVKRERVRRTKFAKVRASMEGDLQKLEEKYSALDSLLSGNKFTVATRKERSRINEMIKEKDEVLEQIQKIKMVLDQNIL
eukprot:maker-scaffold532_size145644-snap-gene-0.40 protein:Tk04533 transcript:maker-scaffold532_size145644-snap-gene-0.40-mRNA-1 annotation:"hypothetical protein"